MRKMPASRPVVKQNEPTFVYRNHKNNNIKILKIEYLRYSHLPVYFYKYKCPHVHSLPCHKKIMCCFISSSSQW